METELIGKASANNTNQIPHLGVGPLEKVKQGLGVVFYTLLFDKF